jgi:hypothetical protein
MMRVISAVAAAVALSLATPALAQEEWDNIKFPEDGFEVNFPGKPKVETTTWVSQYRYNLPAKVYSATHGRERYSVTIVDYRVLPKMGEERAKQCPAGAETCIGTQDGRRGGIIGLGYWKMDVRGALAFAALKFVQRPGAKVTDMNLQFEQVVEGLFMQLTNADESRTFGYVTMHENRLYVFEGTVPKGMPEPGLFQGSVGFVDAKGGSIRYTDYYSNAIHGLRQQEPPSFRVDGGPPQTWPPSAAITDENHAGGMDSPPLDAPAPGAGAGRGRGAGAGAGAPAGTGRY